MKKWFKGFLLFSLSLFLTACVSMQAAPQAKKQKVPWQQRKVRLAAIKHWEISGAVAVKTSEKAFTASLNWQQLSKSRYIINLFGPLGMGAVNLTGNSGRVVLKHNNETYIAKTSEALLQQHMGWQLPVANLYYWVRGLPAPSLPARASFDQYGRLTQLNQQGWQIRYLRYTAVGKNNLPSKIFIQNRYMQARLVISQWQI